MEEINKGALDKPLRPQKKRKKYIGDSASEMEAGLEGLKARVKWLPKGIAQYINLQCKVCKIVVRYLKPSFRVRGVGVPDVNYFLVKLEDLNKNVVLERR